MPIRMSFLVLFLFVSIRFLCGQNTQSSDPSGQPSPTPTPAEVPMPPGVMIGKPASPAQVEQLQNMMMLPRGDATPVPAEVPIRATYGFYFRHIAALDAFAAKLEANGKDGNPWRTHEQRSTGLTAQQAEMLKSVSYDCNQAVAGHDKKIHDAIAAFHDQNPNWSSLGLPSPPEVHQLFEERQQIIQAHIDRLRSLLGETAFQKLDSHVKSNFRGMRTQLVPGQSNRASNAQGPKQ